MTEYSIPIERDKLENNPPEYLDGDSVELYVGVATYPSSGTVHLSKINFPNGEQAIPTQEGLRKIKTICRLRALSDNER